MTSNRSTRPPWLRPATAAMAVGLTTAVLAWWLIRVVLSGWHHRAGPTPTTADEVLTLAAAVLALLLALWLAAAVLVEVLGYLPGAPGRAAGALQRELTPLAARRAAAFLVGVGLSGALAPGTALASTRSAGEPAGPGFTVSAPERPSAPSAADDSRPPAPGWTPDRPRVREQHGAELLTPSPRHEGAPVVVVRRGDTLWDIAERHLGTGATEAEIAVEWPRWYHANQEVIGDNPHLILPGQRLHPPVEVAGG